MIIYITWWAWFIGSVILGYLNSFWFNNIIVVDYLNISEK